MKIAVVGTGIAGLVVARGLAAQHEIEVFEANDYVGGHTNTVTVASAAGDVSVDTGFIVFNRGTYPSFCRLLDELDVASRETDMAFSLSCRRSGLEWAATSLDGLFAQRRNLVRPSFLRMLADARRFQREAADLLADERGDLPLGEALEREAYSTAFIEGLIVPLGASIWSAPPAAMLDMPARFFIRFFLNHGFLQVRERPVWRTIQGGSARYVERLIAPFRERIHLRCPVRRITRSADGVQVTPLGAAPRRFDEIVIATHSDTALALLGDPSPTERAILGALPYQRNEAVLHTDTSVLPRRKRAWASWNHHVPDDASRPVAVTYWMNRLQGLTTPEQYLVTLNPSFEIAAEKVVQRFSYDHPVFTLGAIAAQERWGEISGVRHTHYCGAYWRYGFHEDGVVSGLRVLAAFARRHGQARATRGRAELATSPPIAATG